MKKIIKRLGLKGMLGIFMIGITIFAAIFAPFLSPHNPYKQNLFNALQPPGTIDDSGNYFIMGTDAVGRDIFSRLLYGARISIIVGLGAVLISFIIGCILGLISGFMGGIIDSVIMRLVDIQMAIPMLIFAIMWVAFFGGGLKSLIIVIGVWGWVHYARFTRGQVLSIKENAYVEASYAIGASNFSIIFKHIAPNLIGSVIVLASLRLGHAVILESTLSFIGIGIQPPTPSWGGMLAENRNYLDIAWWAAVFPGIAITLFVLGANLLGDALRDLFDPKTHWNE